MTALSANVIHCAPKSRLFEGLPRHIPSFSARSARTSRLCESGTYRSQAYLHKSHQLQGNSASVALDWKARCQMHLLWLLSKVSKMGPNLLWKLQAGSFSLDSRAQSQLLLSVFNVPKKADYRNSDSASGDLTAGPRGEILSLWVDDLLPCKLAGQRKSLGNKTVRKKKGEKGTGEI